MIPAVDTSALSGLKRTAMNSIVALLSRDQTLFSLIVEDFVELLRAVLLVCEMKGHPAAAFGQPTVRAFRNLSSMSKSEPAVEVTFSTETSLARFQSSTVQLLGNLLSVTVRDTVLQHQSAVKVWHYACAQLASRTASPQMSLFCLKLLSTHMHHHHASLHAYTVRTSHSESLLWLSIVFFY